ncbi:hypothetical protein [Prosthecobacter sp.]|uniref:hypothetical protein n=1 Tax=Prosthecobacter sp. TaxID=1965333 RepID=UPI002AB92596|nr:hypothetical protein [Prosthecobacter sp.]MDZ4401322.1 hypothetical protein [Prosthecobacter sp.]
MIRHLPFVQAVVIAFICATLFATAQTPAPPFPQLTKEQKAAAAAIEAPKTFTPPPLPGQLQGNAPAKPAAPSTPPTEPAKAVVPPPAGNAASKMQVLEAVTQPAANQVPRSAAPSDKIPITSSTSTTGQFIVHGKVFQTRSAMSTRCEEISQELRKVLHDKEPWVLPVVVLLNTGEEATKSKGPPISTAITELTHGGFHVQVTINERPGLKETDLRKEVARALLAERILRNHQKITTPEGRLLLPDWIMTGVLHAMDYRASARPSALFSTIFRSGKIYGIEEIIEASPVEMDGLSRTIYETSCCALVLALVDQPDGSQRFNKFLNALASDPRSERELLSAAFPNFAASASSLNKWWSLQLATLSKPGIAEPFTAVESLKAIEGAITIRYEAKPDEVPKNVKPRPFVLPTPLVVASSEPRPLQPSVTDDPPKPKSKDTAEPKVGEAEDASDEKPKRSLWRRLLFLGDPDEDESKTAETPVANEAAHDAEKKPGFFGRLFGAGSDEKKETDKPKAAEVEKPKTAAADELGAKEEKKPSLLNPLNWFRGGSKDEEPKKEDLPVKDAQAPGAPSASLDVARLISPALADAWQWLAPAAPRMTAEPLFDFRKRKPKPDEEKKEETPRKAAAKQDSKPRTSNPNSKSTSKPSTAPSGTPRTNNPNAKPVPAELIKPATGAAPLTSAAKSGLVPVVLPLEEYQHILKRPDRVQILNYNVASLRALELRVSVLFRPVVTGYLAAVVDLQAGKTKDMEKRLATLHAFALVAYQKSIAVRDYLDWFEASENGRLSGKFDDFLELPAIIQKELPPRTDPISKYLDAIDKEFTK